MSKYRVYLTRTYDFCATHRLYNPAFSDAKNCEVFRECNNVNGHGHNYTLEVTVCGVPDAETGMIVDIWDLDGVVKDRLIQHVDHKNMNLDVAFLKDQIPTAEVMVKAFWNELDKPVADLKAAKLYRLRLLETKNNFAEYRGEN